MDADSGQWLDVIWNPPEVGCYPVRKFSVERNEWFVGTGYYFGGSDMRWRIVRYEGGNLVNIGPLHLEGLEYLAPKV